MGFVEFIIIHLPEEHIAINVNVYIGVLFHVLANFDRRWNAFSFSGKFCYIPMIALEYIKKNLH